MELRFQAGGPESWSADAVIVFLSEDEKLEKAYPELLDAAPWMSIAPGMRDFHGKKGEMGLLYGPPAHPLSRAVVVGLGKLDALTYAETLEEIRKGAGAAAVRCRELGVDTLALPVSGLARFNADVERTIEEIVCAAMLGLWRNKAFKSKEPEDADPRWLALLFCDANVPDFPRLAARRGETHAEAVILARNLANIPANSLTPEDMAEEARKLARRHDMNCEVLEREDIVSLGMGAFAAVAAGSANDPRLIILEHAPAGHADEAPLIVVGKGITFDSGGISIKPAAGMWEMKGDMGGAAAVMGLFEALGQLARRPRDPARRRGEDPQRQDRGNRQHRRRGAPCALRRPDLRAAALEPFHDRGRGDPHGRVRRGPRRRRGGSVLPGRHPCPAHQGLRRHRGRTLLAPAPLGPLF